MHACCLPVLDTAVVSSTGRDYRKEVENDAIEAMCSKLSTLAVLNPSVVNMLKANDLEDLVACAQNVRDTASTICYANGFN